MLKLIQSRGNNWSASLLQSRLSKNLRSKVNLMEVTALIHETLATSNSDVNTAAFIRLWRKFLCVLVEVENSREGGLLRKVTDRFGLEVAFSRYVEDSIKKIEFNLNGNIGRNKKELSASLRCYLRQDRHAFLHYPMKRSREQRRVTLTGHWHVLQLYRYGEVISKVLTKVLEKSRFGPAATASTMPESSTARRHHHHSKIGDWALKMAIRLGIRKKAPQKPKPEMALPLVHGRLSSEEQLEYELHIAFVPFMEMQDRLRALLREQKLLYLEA